MCSDCWEEQLVVMVTMSEHIRLGGLGREFRFLSNESQKYELTYKHVAILAQVVCPESFRPSCDALSETSIVFCSIRGDGSNTRRDRGVSDVR